MSRLLPLLPLLGLVVACTDGAEAVPPGNDAGPVDPEPDGRADDVARLALSVPTNAIDPGTVMGIGVQAFDVDDNVVETPPITWSSEDPSTVAVSPLGEVTGLALGSSRITARSGDVYSWITIHVAPSIMPVARVAITPVPSKIEIGETVQLGATTFDASDNVLVGRIVTWASSSPLTAAVGPDGNVTGLDIGTATITARSEGQTAQVTITIRAGVDSVEFEQNGPLSMFLPDVRQLSVKARDEDGNIVVGRPVTWESTNPSIASVSPAGLVTANTNGNVFVRATVSGVSNFIAVRVRTVASMTINLSDAIIDVGQSVQLRAQITDTHGQPVHDEPTWASIQPAIASVDKTGKVTAHAQGETTVTGILGGKFVFARIVVASWKESLLTHVNDAALPGTLYEYEGMRMTVDQGRLRTRAHDGTFELYVMGTRYESGKLPRYDHHNTAGTTSWDDSTQTYKFVPDVYGAGPAFTGRKVTGGTEITYQPDPNGAPAVLFFAD